MFVTWLTVDQYFHHRYSLQRCWKYYFSCTSIWKMSSNWSWFVKCQSDTLWDLELVDLYSVLLLCGHMKLNSLYSLSSWSTNKINSFCITICLQWTILTTAHMRYDKFYHAHRLVYALLTMEVTFLSYHNYVSCLVVSGFPCTHDRGEMGMVG